MRNRLLLLLVSILPNINTVGAGFVLDDVPLIVENARLHSLSGLASVWTSGYWPDRHGLTLYRPVTQSLWSLLWNLGGGRPILFHIVNVVLAAAVVLLLYELILAVTDRPLIAFGAAAIFAVLPIHCEAIASVVGSAELLAALFGTAALLALVRNRPVLAVLLFALAVFSKESAAAILAIGFLIAPRPRRRYLGAATIAAAVVVGALIARQAIATGPVFIPPIDNATALLPWFPRLLTALWVQCLYLSKTVVPITLSADYSYKQIPLVMSLGDIRAWCGLLLAASALVVVIRRPRTLPRRARVPQKPLTVLWAALVASIVIWAILFSPAANVLFPIGTIMGERLAYAPSVAVALFLGYALGLLPTRHAVPLLVLILAAYGTRTVMRNREWHDANVFYTGLIRTAPASCKSHYFYGTLLASEGDDKAAIAEYEKAIAIFPAYSEAYQNRGNALARMGRYDEAAESYRMCLRFDPGHTGAAQNLMALEAGIPLNPARKKL